MRSGLKKQPGRLLSKWHLWRNRVCYRWRNVIEAWWYLTHSCQIHFNMTSATLCLSLSGRFPHTETDQTGQTRLTVWGGGGPAPLAALYAWTETTSSRQHRGQLRETGGSPWAHFLLRLQSVTVQLCSVMYKEYVTRMIVAHYCWLLLVMMIKKR